MKAVLVGVFAVLGATMWCSGEVKALSSAPVVISHVQAGATGAAAEELVAIYNNSGDDIDITDWCLTNKSSTAIQFKAFACFVPETDDEKLILPPGTYAVVVSSAFAAAYTETEEPQVVVYDIVFPTTGGVIVATADIIGLYDAGQTLVDEVDWTNLESGKLLQRTTRTDSSTGLLDTDSRTDFTKVIAPIIPPSGLTYVRFIVDVCGNLESIQETIPPGYGYDEAKNCEQLSADLCGNLADIQLVIPDGLQPDGSGACVADVCLNIPGIQMEVPQGYTESDSECHALEDRHVIITEVLANVSGSDDGKEFIELYNPHEQAVSLVGYVLRAGKNLEAAIPLSGTISPKGYVVFSDTELDMTLLNTLNQLSIVTPAGNTTSATIYSNAPEDESWSLVDDVWVYTDQPTPGSVNEGRADIDDSQAAVVLGTTLPPCTTGKYRHPITNRCRNIVTDTNMLVACDTDEYRNPETNRCRKVAGLAVALTPCSDGYERNPATNRCRKAGTTVTALKPCQSGYERNPATNRCRKANLAANAAATPAAITHAQETAPLRTALVVTVGVGAVGYALYEWRSELSRFVRRASQGIKPK